MKRLILVLVLLSVCSAAATGTVSGLLIKRNIDSANATQRHRLYLAQVAGCERQNVRTAAVNKNALATYEFDTFFARALTAPQGQQTERQRKLTKNFRGLLLGTVATLTWTPLNHACVKEPTAVQLPVPFSARQPKKRDLKA